MAWGHPFGMPWGGGGDSQTPFEVEFYALLDCYAPGWTSAEDTQSACECRAMALGLACIWALNKRLEGIMVPQRMLESLETWEQACTIRPTADETLQQRRSAIAARFLGFAGNTASQIYDVCAALAGSQFLGIVTAAPALGTSYSPGVQMGPPGAEYASNRATIGVRLSRTGAVGSDFTDLVRRIKLALNSQCPAWMTFAVGTFEGGATAGAAICGLTLI